MAQMRRLSPRQESFARAIVSGCSGSAAARRAGYSAARANRAAYEAVTNRDVARRIAQLQVRAAARVPLSRQAHIERLAEIGRQAGAAGQYAVATRCEELIGKVAGHYV